MAIDDLPAAPRTRILFLAANPDSTSPLHAGREVRKIRESLAMSEHRSSIELVERWALRPGDLQRALFEVKPQIVHFSGHGTTEYELMLEGDDSNPHPIGKDILADIFKLTNDHARVVFLSACHSLPQAEAIAEHIDCTIGMRQAIGSEAAAEFSAAFYLALGFGRSVHDAFESARVELKAKNIPEDRTPRLVVRRDDVNAKCIFLIGPQLPPPREPEPVPGDSAFAKLSSSMKAVPGDLKVAVALLALSLLYIAIITGSSLSIPAFSPGRGGLVIAGAQSPRKALCDKLGESGDREGIRCLTLPWGFSQGDLKAAAKDAGASMAVIVNDDATVQILPLGQLEGDALLEGGVPPIDIARKEDVARLAPLLQVLAHSSAPKYDLQPIRVQCPPIAPGPGALDRIELMTLFAALRVPGCVSTELKRTKVDAVCDLPDSKWSCAVARYFHIEQHPNDSDATADLKWLRDRGPAGFHRSAEKKLALLQCESNTAEDLAEAEDAYRSLSRDPDICAHAASTEIADCLFALAPGKSTLTRQEVEETFDRGLAECHPSKSPPLARAELWGRRGYWRGRGGDWNEAARNYHAAALLSKQPIYWLSEAESMLHLGRGEAANELLARNDLGEDGDFRDRIYEDLLRWLVAGRPPPPALEAASLLADYEKYVPEDVQVFKSGDIDLAKLVCPVERTSSCALEVLESKKNASSSKALDRALRIPD